MTRAGKRGARKPTAADAARWSRATTDDREDGTAPALGGVASWTDNDHAVVEDVFDTRVLGCLKRAGVDYMGDLRGRTEQDLLGVRGWGKKTILAVRDALEELGLPPLRSGGLNLRKSDRRRDAELADLLDAVASDLKGHIDDHRSVLAPDDLNAQRRRVIMLRSYARSLR